MGINGVKVALLVTGLGVTTAVAVTIAQIKKHGGHITVGIGSREFGWEFDGKKKINEVGEN